jgi:heme A synthase
MRAYRFAVATAAATFLLLVIGGLVHPTGSSLACPDWPLCNGMVFPPMRGGILYEHGHRLAALLVAVLTAALAMVVFRDRRERDLRALAVVAVVLVGFQAALGAITVIYRLPLLVSASHLATSMAFFSLVLYLAHRLQPGEGWAPPVGRGLVGLAAAVIYAQIVVGALVRHTGSALACGTDLLLCEGSVWPSWGPAQVQVTHRLLGYLVAALVLGSARRTWRLTAAGPPIRRRLALLAPALAMAQVTLGLLTVASYVSLPLVALHLAFGAALLAAQLTLYFLLGPRGATARWQPATPAARLAPQAAP